MLYTDPHSAVQQQQYTTHHVKGDGPEVLVILVVLALLV